MLKWVESFVFERKNVGELDRGVACIALRIYEMPQNSSLQND